MTPHPPEPPAEWESPPQSMLARDQRPVGSYPASGYYGNGYPADGYPPLSDHPSMPGYPPLSDHPSMPGYPPLSDHPSMPGYPRVPDYWPDPSQPADSHVDHDEYVHPSDTAAPVTTTSPAMAHPLTGGPAIDELPQRTPSVPVPPAPEPIRPSARLATAGLAPPGWPPAVPEPVLLEPMVLEPAPARAGVPGGGRRPRARPAASEDAHWAMLAYLTVPIFGCIVSLAIYLLSLRGSRWLRTHAAQALNLWLTWLLYNISALIAGGLLALDSPRVALMVVLPAVATLWLIMLAYLIRAARLASRGRECALPRWLCSQIIR
jgi:hypothetical protein